MLDLIKNSSADSQQLLSQVNLPSLFDMQKMHSLLTHVRLYLFLL
jgi:hypothetical protein